MHRVLPITTITCRSAHSDSGELTKWLLFDDNVHQRGDVVGLLHVFVVELAGLDIADPPERWEALGFAVREGSTDVGGVRLHLGGPGVGITGWTLTGAESMPDLNGLRTNVTSHTPGSPPSLPHPNGATAIDHVVIVTPDFARTAQALAAAGLELRRIDDAGRGFRRIGPAILELVEAREAPATHFWGLVVIVEDLEALAARLGEHIGHIKPAVQPGRRIATLRSSAGLNTRVAFMDPEPRRVR